MLKLYNYLSRKKERFRPLRPKGTVGLYTCGPTVYDYAHIGNLRTYIFEDILRRALVSFGYRVKHVMNITDVGHLTSDADTGADKIEEGAKRESKSVWDIASFFTKAFLADTRKLQVLRAHILAPATKEIPSQIKIIKQLIRRGYAYETEKAVYFNVPKFRGYTKLSRQPLAQQRTGARDEVIVDGDKKHPADFALWFKLVGRYKNHVMRWDSPWGPGFPGWHIECSAISTKYLGQPFDIHTGGIDHVTIHHTNEIAQSESAYGKSLARFWIEGEHMLIDSKKMSKSIGNFYTLTDLEARNFDPLAFRYLVLTAHYRSRLNFTWDSLKAAQLSLKRLHDFVHELRAAKLKNNARPHRIFKNADKKFFDALANDLDTPKALSVLWQLVRRYRNTPKDFDPKLVLKLFLKFDTVLGLNLEYKASSITKRSALVENLAKKREGYRQQKEWAKADKIRSQLEKLGFTVEDTKGGYRLKKLPPT